MMKGRRPSRLSDQDMVRGKESGRCRGQSSGSEIQSLSYVDSSARNIHLTWEDPRTSSPHAVWSLATSWPRLDLGKPGS